MRWFHSKEAALDAFRGRSSRIANADVQGRVRDILDDVRRRGDEALRAWTRELDGADLPGPLVPPGEIAAARGRLAPALADAIELSADRVRAFYARQPVGGFLEQRDGALLGQLVRPLERVACYAPGGTAPLFSSVLMTAVPARVAGVEEVVVATPPRRDGSVAPEILHAAAVAGVREVYRMGGAQAVAALAFGTSSVRAVDKIVGPGNDYVVEAKRQVFGTVGIEALPGPTETLVLADAGADPRHVIADLLAQAEHLGAQPVLVTPSRELAERVVAGLESALADLSTAVAARASLEQRGSLVIVEDLVEGVEVANAFAPEHLCLLVRDPWALVPRVRNAGGIFVGDTSTEALGDYIAGPSHVMPTGGTARYASFVNLRDFQKVIPLVAMDAELVSRLAPPAALMARAEGLEAHARALEARLAGPRPPGATPPDADGA